MMAPTGMGDQGEQRAAPVLVYTEKAAADVQQLQQHLTAQEAQAPQGSAQQ
jgi:hypothetical protein